MKRGERKRITNTSHQHTKNTQRVHMPTRTYRYEKERAKGGWTVKEKTSRQGKRQTEGERENGKEKQNEEP